MCKQVNLSASRNQEDDEDEETDVEDGTDEETDMSDNQDDTVKSSKNYCVII